MNAIDSTTLKERCGCAMHFHRKEKGITSEKLNQAKIVWFHETENSLIL